MPTSASSRRTSHSAAASTGPSTDTTLAIGRATASAWRSGAMIAAVFGNSSQNTMISTVIATVA